MAQKCSWNFSNFLFLVFNFLLECAFKCWTAYSLFDFVMSYIFWCLWFTLYIYLFCYLIFESFVSRRIFKTYSLCQFKPNTNKFSSQIWTLCSLAISKTSRFQTKKILNEPNTNTCQARWSLVRLHPLFLCACDVWLS